MELGFTFPLQRKLRRGNLPYGAEVDLSQCWDLHCIILGGRSCLLAVHCASRYAFTVYDVSPFQWADVEQTFLSGLETTCQAIGIDRPDCGTVAVSRTHGRRPVAFLNRAWEDVMALDFTLDTTTQFQPLLDLAVNQKVCNCAGFTGKGQPLQRFFSCFEKKNIHLL